MKPYGFENHRDASWLNWKVGVGTHGLRNPDRVIEDPGAQADHNRKDVRRKAQARAAGRAETRAQLRDME